MKKKILMFLLPALLTGCGGNNITDEPSSTPSEIVKTYEITIKENPNCKISVSKTVASRNETIEVFVTDIKSGYEVSKITVNGMKIDNNKFIMPNENVEIEVYLVNTNNTDGVNSVEIPNSEYALIWVDHESYDAGENVEIEYQCKGNYVLDYFTVNGEMIDGTSFEMPDGDALIEGTFKLAFEETPWQILSTSGGLTARAFYYFNYGEEGLEIKIKVDDRMICGKEFKEQEHQRDNVEIIITPKSDHKGWAANETFKILVTADGDVNINRAVAGNQWGIFSAKEYTEEDFNYSVTLKHLENNDGYNGYEVNIFFSYALMWLDREEAINNLTVCPAIRNTTSHNVTSWNCINLASIVWEDCSTHPILLENGLYQERG
ncbi:MAG: hypothetical protein IJD46_02615 [Bacilli bacterium]|nr:hypothetical protein [Bacilli bacterium]